MVAGTLYETFLRNVAPVRAFLEPMRMTSIEAVLHFAPGSCDLVILECDS